MPKTDKELTVEVVNTFVASWNAKNSTNAMKGDDVIDLINNVYETIQSLDDNV